MQKDKIVVGLDIGSTKICALVGRQDKFGKVEILGMGKAASNGVFRGVVTNINKTIQAMEEAIEEASEQSGIDIRIVNAGIAGQHIKSMKQRGSIHRPSSDDEITVEDVNRLTNEMYRTVTQPGDEIIHVMPQDYTVDLETGVKEPVGMSGIKLEADFNIITAQTSAVNNINKCVRRAGLEIDNLILEPIASGMSVLTEEEREAGVALVDIGGGTTDVAIFYENIIRHTAVIPLGGQIITNDIKEGCVIMEKQAERLKIKHGRAIAEEASTEEFVSVPGLHNRPAKEISLRTVAEIIEARMCEIIEMVHQEIIKSGYLNKLVGGIVITGGGSQLKHCDELFHYMTKMDTRIGYPTEYLGKSKVAIAQNPMYATAMGLVIAGFRAIDERDNRYHQISSGSNLRKPKKEGEGRSFFWQIIERTKGMLIDDVEDDRI
ncbi:cell division protein FtsA [Eisenibacter elegans]|jgi:cell division protein FtsA|uniref:cell division protein FtsA n=1 Tax=Eisenibacter elegans TaxID=997 RepID=UPI0004201D25|nr:cell division protein FtsA [Eisenibacter elegans]